MFLENTIQSDPVEDSLRRQYCSLEEKLREVVEDLELRINFKNSTPRSQTEYICFLDGTINAYQSNKNYLEQELTQIIKKLDRYV
jgi:hypothetical protein